MRDNNYSVYTCTNEPKHYNYLYELYSTPMFFLLNMIRINTKHVIIMRTKASTSCKHFRTNIYNDNNNTLMKLT